MKVAYYQEKCFTTVLGSIRIAVTKPNWKWSNFIFENKMKVNVGKTEFLLFRRHNKLKKNINCDHIKIGKLTIKVETEAKNRGIIWDYEGKQIYLVNNIYKIGFYHVRNLVAIRKSFDVKTAKTHKLQHIQHHHYTICCIAYQKITSVEFNCKVRKGTSCLQFGRSINQISGLWWQNIMQNRPNQFSAIMWHVCSNILNSLINSTGDSRQNSSKKIMSKQ